MIESGESCGALASEDGTVEWRVWAPKSRRVDLILIEGFRRLVQPMIQLPQGYFRHRRAQVADGQRYAYSIDQGPIGRIRHPVGSRME